MTGWLFVAAVLLVLAAFLLLSDWAQTWFRYRGVRVITCPENLEPAAVKVDAGRAARMIAIAGEKDLHLKACSRWPEMAGCAEDCLAQIEGSHDGCSLKALVTQWYEGKSCVICLHPMEKIVWHERPAALRTPRGTTCEWKDILPQNIPNAFATHEPVCWRCHIVESFRREHGEMVIQRVHLPEPHPPLAPSTAVY
jgi:hypothetical protein